MSNDYKDFVTARELALALLELPPNVIVDIAGDPEMNVAGPIAMLENGELSYDAKRLRENGRVAVVLWPMSADAFESRYDLGDD